MIPCYLFRNVVFWKEENKRATETQVIKKQLKKNSKETRTTESVNAFCTTKHKRDLWSSKHRATFVNYKAVAYDWFTDWSCQLVSSKLQDIHGEGFNLGIIVALIWINKVFQYTYTLWFCFPHNSRENGVEISNWK